MLELDHIVIASEKPEVDAKNFGEMFDLEIVAGGKHTNWGTYNYLAFFENNSYIEWIGVFDEALAKKSDNPLIRQLMKTVDQGIFAPFTFALRTNQMDTFINDFDGAEIAYKGPFPGNRKRVDGSSLSWRMLFPTEKEDMPFLIEWGEQINQPEDLSKINERSITTVQVPQTINVDEAIYKLSWQEEVTELINSRLEYTNEASLDFIIPNE